MIKLKAPAGGGNVSYGGEEYRAVQGWVEVPEAAAAELEAHGYLAADQVNAESADDDEHAEPVIDPAKMNRNALFAFLKGKGIAVPLPVTNERLREIATEALAERPAEYPPLRKD